MERAVVSVATGVLNPLYGKLANLLEEFSMVKVMRADIVFLKDEISSMNALLMKLQDTDGVDIQVKEWRDQVRELAYDIEDCIDDFMHSVNHGTDIKGLIQKIKHVWKTLRDHCDIAHQIRELKDRVGHMSKRRKRYKIDSFVSNSSSVLSIDPRLPALYAEAEELVGMDGPRDELIELLTRGEGKALQKLRVVSIVGFGGSGKTTLANQVYYKLQDQFTCRAFVSVSQKPDMIKLLNKILSQVKGQPSSSTCEVKDVVGEIRDYLLDKRYFIIIDDLWDASAWNVVKLVFLENNRSSRVMTTTRIETLAGACCTYHHEYMYKMKLLDDQDSRKLFFNRIFGFEGACTLPFKEVSAEILKKCGGLPLAIITIASLLASQPTKLFEQWEYVRNYLGTTMFGTTLTLEGMRQIFNLSYMDLPCHLKTCFLYLGIYPEDCMIAVDDLVRQWIAEGFVSKVQGQDAEDVAMSYLNELINRSMVQPYLTDYNSNLILYRIHDMMLDFIIYKVREENFITVIDDPRDMVRLHDKVRRLSLQFDVDANYGTVLSTINPSQVRSLAAFQESFIFMFHLLEFKHLRVLHINLRYANSESVFNFTGMCELFQLRYFKIHLDDCFELLLPNKICGLQHLETFEVHGGKDIVIPSDICKLPRLFHLNIRSEMPNGIGNMRSLRTLEFSLTIGNVKGLGELTNLRSLHINIPIGFNLTECMNVLCSSLGKIAKCNLKCLTLWSYEIEARYCDWLSCLSPSPRHLQTLDLQVSWFSRVPKWIGELHKLEILKLKVRELLIDDVHILAQLPTLINLHLSVRDPPEERIVICGTSFPVLKHFVFLWAPYLAFEADAMPKLQRLCLWLQVDKAEQYSRVLGIEHLLSLKEFCALIFSFNAGESEKQGAVESEIRKAIAKHPRCPSVNIICTQNEMSHSFPEDKEDEEGVNAAADANASSTTSTG